MIAAFSFRDRNSVMNRLDPRARWIFSLAYTLAMMLSWDWRIITPLFILGVVWYSMADLSFKETRRSWMMVSMMLFMMVLVNTILTGGGAGRIVPVTQNHIWAHDFQILGRSIHFGLTADRLWFAICQLMRILGISLVFLVIPFSMDTRAYGVTFSRLGLPDKGAYTIELAMRFLPTLMLNMNTTLDAQKARGYEIEKVKGGIIKRMARVAPFLVPVTMNAISSSEDVADAMDLRGFGTQKRSWLYLLNWKPWDTFVVVLGLLAFAAVLLLVTLRGMGAFVTPAWFLRVLGF